jgi:regulator of RNase E activity RraA
VSVSDDAEIAGRLMQGSWRGILSRGAKLREIAGVVVDGPIRDVDEARQLDFLLFCRSFTARTARGRNYEAPPTFRYRSGINGASG